MANAYWLTINAFWFALSIAVTSMISRLSCPNFINHPREGSGSTLVLVEVITNPKSREISQNLVR